MEWEFAEDKGGLDKVGFKDNDIEKFGQDPAKSIVREAIKIHAMPLILLMARRK